MTDNEKIAIWRGWSNLGGSSPWVNPKSDRFMGVPPWDKGCGWWHGEHGLLVEIEKKGLVLSFIAALWDSIRPKSEMPHEAYAMMFYALTATPSQLAAALIKTIERNE